MLASIPHNLVWSESTGPWKVLHTCKDCQTEQLAKYMRLVVTLMGRAPRDPLVGEERPSRLFFKLQSSEGVDVLSLAFPEVPWMFLFREPVEVMMSRMGAQRIGMEGTHDDVAQKLQQMAGKQAQQVRGGGSPPQAEMRNAKTLAGFCQKAITAAHEHPGKGMMVEYTYLPSVMWEEVLPKHFGVKIGLTERAALLKASEHYSKAAENSKTAFSDDKEAKHQAASPAVKAASDKILMPLYQQLQAMQMWLPEEQRQTVQS
ncbi:hypothetical protein JKP88DRAFT_271225 [Tribonema minus]|uniref:Sulfotransferase n=1 Tax=Tribonema minus TaxID=303371 RepID=A0A835ZJN2_9STRA|nr:hypothetical protein JKP88DRAFT_271225 [Tribonema minus]